MGMGGIQRTFYIPRYLKMLGWKVNVYTPHPPHSYPVDKTISECNCLNVIRTFCPDPLHLLRGGFKSVGMGRLDYLTFPDNKVPWLPFLYKNLQSMDVIVTSLPPFSLLLSGLFYKDIPWIIDFRDPWVGSFLGQYRFNWEEKLAMKLERYAVKKASLCVTVTKNHLEYLKSCYSDYSERFYLIRNGYNEDGFPERLGMGRKQDIVITYMGTLNKLRPIEYVFEGLMKLFKERSDIKDNIVFKHIGYSIGVNIKEQAEKAGIKQFVETGYLSHKDALIELLDSDILVLLGVKGEQDKEIIPGKLYEYLRSGIPIVAVTTNEEIEELVSSQGIRCGYNADEIAKGILKIIENPHFFKSIKNYKGFSWENLAKEYSKLIWSVL